MSHQAFPMLEESTQASSSFYPHPLIRRMETFRALPAADKAALEEATGDVRFLPSQTTLLREGDAPKVVRVLVEGFACRCKIIDGGKRQIVGFVLPGDICDAHVFTLSHTDHDVVVLTDARVAVIPRDVVEGTLTARPAIARALL